MIKLIEKSNFDNIEKAVNYFYSRWKYDSLTFNSISTQLKKLGHSDDFIDAVLDGISERYEDEEDYELDESIDDELDYINSMSENTKLSVADKQTKVESVNDSDYIIDRSAYSKIKSVVKKFFSGDRNKYKVGNWVVQKGGYDLVATLEYYEPYGTYSICGIFDGSDGYELKDYHNSEFDFPFFTPTDPIKAALDELNIKSYITESKTKYTSKIVCEGDTEIEVKNPGILEVPEGKSVNDLPMSHFEKLAKKKGLGKITKALNNLQVWNKNDDPELSKWAGNMIDKLNKKLKKDESFNSRADNYGITIYPPNEQLLSDLQQYLDDSDFMFDDDNLAKSYGYDSAEYELDVQDNFARLYFFGTWDQYVRILEFIRNWIDDTGTDVNVKRGYLDPPMSESLELCESYLDYDWRNTYTTRELKEMSAEKLLDLKWYDAGFTKADLVTVTDDYNNSTRQPLENFFSDKQYDTWYPAQTEDGLELFMRMNGRSSSIEVVSGLRTLKYGARVINHVVRAGKVTIDSFRTKDDLFKWILDTDFGQD